MSENPVINAIGRTPGIAGQVRYAATVTYPGEPPETVAFVGSPQYGGPVVMITPHGTQVFVTEPGRFGAFGERWGRRFFDPLPV